MKGRPQIAVTEVEGLRSYRLGSRRRGVLTSNRQRALLVAVLALALTLAMAGVSEAGSVKVTDLSNGATPAGLAESLAGGGVSISNVTYIGNSRAAGEFTSGADSISFENGIVLDTGKVETYPTDEPCSKGVEGPNTCYEATEGKPEGPSGGDNSTAFGEPGDAELSGLSGFPTFDASILEFDFVPQHSTAQFSYVFGSEEYSDYANTEFNDVFGFFVDGTNCALVPGTNEPVSINTINNGNDEGGDTTPHHPELFRDNVRPEPTIDTQMDGLTTVLTCTAAVKEGQENHVKLAIADSSDEYLDSAVFIQAKSLVSGTQVSTSLTGGGHSGEKITVPDGTAVADQATLSGANAGKATGTVEYKVYSDPECKNLVASAGGGAVSGGVAPASSEQILSPGTYYWRASYGGDANNNASESACGAEVETVAEPESTGPQLDGIASAQHYNEATTKLTTKESGDLIVAFVAADSPFTVGQTSTVSGGGLTWTLVGRENKALGGAEVWVARASGVLTEDPITAHVNTLLPGSPSGLGYDETITVAAFKNASGLGAVGKFSSKKGAATGTLTTTKANSWVWAIGDDWLASIARTVPAGQTLWHEATDKVGDTYWVQSAGSLTKEAGTAVTINDPSPTKDPFDLVMVEIL